VSRAFVAVATLVAKLGVLYKVRVYCEVQAEDEERAEHLLYNKTAQRADRNLKDEIGPWVWGGGGKTRTSKRP
jgi:hypothetical protein